MSAEAEIRMKGMKALSDTQDPVDAERLLVAAVTAFEPEFTLSRQQPEAQTRSEIFTATDVAPGLATCLLGLPEAFETQRDTTPLRESHAI